jgi:hypothetical protein
MIALRVELDRVPTGEHEGSTRFPLPLRRCSRVVIVDGLSQLIEGLSETAEGVVPGLMRPKQTGQGISAMGTVGFDNQVGQQSACVVRGEISDRLAVQGHSERSH